MRGADKVNVHWVTIRNQRVKFVDVKTGTLEQQNDIDFYHYVILPPTDMVDLTVFARRQNSNLTLLNNFVVTSVLGQYSRTKHGWEMTDN